MKKGCGCAILLIVLAVLAFLAWRAWNPAPTTSSPASASPTTAPETSRAELLRKRQQVFHQPYNASEQEVTDTPTTAGQGDRVRTLSKGKALLKWPDLQVMLYGGTDLKAKESTPTWISLGLLAGTTVAGVRPGSGQRLVLVNDYAEITFSGTTVMAAYLPEQRLTIMRVFEGQAVVSNLEMPTYSKPVNQGEWALVEPGGKPPEVFDDPARMRRRARELGLWDVFHEVEMDVAEGFGPAPVPRQDVAIIFEEQATDTPTPSPCRPNVWYCEDFRDGQAQGWKFGPGWTVTQEGGNGLISGAGSYSGALFDQSWEDYRVHFRLKLKQGGIDLLYRWTDGPTGYIFGFDQGGLSLSKQVRDTLTDPVRVPAPLELDRWYNVKIVGWGGRLQVSVDDKVELDYTYDDPLRNGTIAFQTHGDSAAQVDDIEVLGSGPPPPPLQPTPAPAAPTPVPPPPAPAPTPYITCSPDHTTIEAGECAVLSWNVGNVQAVYLDGEVVTVWGGTEVCPRESHPYELRAVTGTGELNCLMAVDVVDTTPPMILEVWFEPHHPPCNSVPGAILARVTDRGRVEKVETWGGKDWQSLTARSMIPIGGDVYRYDYGVISYREFVFDIRAWDGFGNMAKTPDVNYLECAP